MRLLSLLLALGLSSTAYAVFDLSPKRVFFYSDASNATLVIKNKNPEPTRFVIRAVARYEDRPTPELIAYPPVFELANGESQVVRFLMRGRDAITPPHFYRVLVREEDAAQPTDAPAPASQDPKLGIVFALPLYYIDRDAKPIPRSALQRGPDGQPEAVILQNTGNTLMHVNEVRDANGAGGDMGVVILPGEAHRLTIGELELPLTFRIGGAGEFIVR